VVSLPDFRRIYPVAEVNPQLPEVLSPGEFPVGNPDVLQPVSETGAIKVSGFNEIPREFYRVYAGSEVDIREGVDISGAASISNAGVFGGIVFVPFESSSPRPFSGEINWNRIGRLSSDVRIGLKEDAGALPYASGRVNWNGGIGHPVTWYSDFHHYGVDNPGFSMAAGSDIDLLFSGSDWSLYSSIEGGGWYAREIGGGFIRSVLAGGVKWPESGVSLDFGADVAFSSSSGLTGLPFLRFNWKPLSSLSIFAGSRLISGFPASMDSVFRREKMSGFNPEIPVSSQYRIGISRGEREGFFYRLEVAYGYGRFPRGENGYITSVEDKRIYGSAGLGFNIGNQRVGFSGEWDASVEGKVSLWESRIEYSIKTMTVYLTGGSEDAILAGYFPGIRGETPIMGIGFNWDIRGHWGIETLAYTEIPWNQPSLRVSLNWRDWSN